jgi:hypothetical protein
MNKTIDLRKQEFADLTADIAADLEGIAKTPLYEKMERALELSMSIIDMADVAASTPKYLTSHHNAIANKDPKYFNEEYVAVQNNVINENVHHHEITAIAQASDHIYSLPGGIYFSTNGNFMFNNRTKMLTLSANTIPLDDAQTDELLRVLTTDFRCRLFK